MKHIRVILSVLVLLCALSCCAITVSAEGADAADISISEIDIGISPVDYKKLISSDQKVQYDVDIDSKQCGAVSAAINIRGNSSKGFGLASTTKRIPFELSFEEAQRFGGIDNKSVKFINSLTPYRLFSEYLALELFEYAGIPTPAHSLAFVRFNNVDFGLYIAVEDVNKTFLRKWYDEPLNSAYKATFDPEKYADYNESEWFGMLFEKVSGSPDLLVDLISALNNKQDYEQYIDIDEWLRYFACVAMTGGDGSILTEKNNFVLYENDGKFELIPWDVSEAFSGKRTPDSIDRFYVRGKEDEPNPLFDLIMSNEDNRERYYDYIRELNESFLEPSRIQARYDALLDAAEPYLKRDHSILLNGEETMSQLRSDAPDTYANLRWMLNEYHYNLIAQLEGGGGSFVVNEMYADHYETWGSYADIIAVCEPLSPYLDDGLPGTIIKAGKRLYGSSEYDRAYWTLGIVLAAAAIVFAVKMIREKKKKDAEGAAFSPKSVVCVVRDFISGHRMMLFIFAFLLLYESIFARQLNGWKVGEYAYLFHALDYSVGFCSRVFVGAVSDFLLGEASVLRVTVMETVLLLLFFAVLSWLAEKLYLRFDTSARPWAALLIFLFVTGPCTFGIYVKELGMIDTWWLYCAVFVVLLSFHKKLWPLIVPVAFVLSLIYFASILCFAPFIVIILLYKAGVEPEGKDRKWLYIIAAAFAVVAVGSALYFIGPGMNNIRLTPEEFYSLLRSRGCTGDLDEMYRVMYSIPPEESGLSARSPEEAMAQLGLRSEVLAQIVIRLRQHWTIFTESTKTKYLQVIYAFLLVCPVLLLLHSCFAYKMKNSEKLPQKFTFFCMMALFYFVTVTSLFVSTDTLKWVAHGFMLTFACFLYVLYHEPRLMSERLIPMLKKIPVSVWICYCAVYAVSVFHPYS